VSAKKRDMNIGTQQLQGHPWAGSEEIHSSVKSAARRAKGSSCQVIKENGKTHDERPTFGGRADIPIVAKSVLKTFNHRMA
jgi:hypothetical protein